MRGGQGRSVGRAFMVIRMEREHNGFKHLLKTPGACSVHRRLFRRGILAPLSSADFSILNVSTTQPSYLTSSFSYNPISEPFSAGISCTYTSQNTDIPIMDMPKAIGPDSLSTHSGHLPGYPIWFPQLYRQWPTYFRTRETILTGIAAAAAAGSGRGRGGGEEIRKSRGLGLRHDRFCSQRREKDVQPICAHNRVSDICFTQSLCPGSPACTRKELTAAVPGRGT